MGVYKLIFAAYSAAHDSESANINTPDGV